MRFEKEAGQQKQKRRIENSLAENNVWELVDNQGNQPIHSSCTFSLKLGPSGAMMIYSEIGSQGN